jgi:hypothetical protein
MSTRTPKHFTALQTPETGCFPRYGAIALALRLELSEKYAPSGTTDTSASAENQGLRIGEQSMKAEIESRVQM